MDKTSYIPLGIAFFVFIFLSIDIVPNWIKSMKKCKECKKRFNKQYVSYQYGCGDYECRCGWKKDIEVYGEGVENTIQLTFKN